MKSSVQLTLGVQICAGMYAVHRGDSLAAFLAFTSASSTYLASEEADKAALLAASAGGSNSISVAVSDYLAKLAKGLV